MQKKQYVDYNANSSKRLNILSAITLGKRVYKKIKNFSVLHFRAAFTYWIRLINDQLIYGEILWRSLRSEVLGTEGELAFNRCLTEILALQITKENVVVTTDESIIYDEKARELLKSEFTS